jgi:hypothetical protein
VCYDGLGCAEDPCDGVQCAAGYFCHGGACFSSCTEDEKCDAENFLCYEGVGCAEDPCDGVRCATGYACHGGACFLSCTEHEQCDAENFLCYDGIGCAEDPCEDVRCATGYVCHGGACFLSCTEHEQCDAENLLCYEGIGCAEDPCDGVQCPVGMACYYGTCFVLDCFSDEDCPDGSVCHGGDGTTYCGAPDDPCHGVQCTTDEVCTEGVCGPPCEDQTPADVVVTGPAQSLEPGDVEALSATVYDACGAVVADAEVTWSSHDACVASIDEAGMATALGGGSTIITATAGEASGTFTLSVSAAPEGEGPISGSWRVCSVEEDGSRHHFDAHLVHTEGETDVSGTVDKVDTGATHTISSGTWDGAELTFNWYEFIAGGSRLFRAFEIQSTNTARMDGKYDDRRAAWVWNVKLVRLPEP